jgi:hypothetical protein
MGSVIQSPAPYSNPIKKIADLLITVNHVFLPVSQKKTPIPKTITSLILINGTDFCDRLRTYVRRRNRSQYGVGERYGSA